MSLESMIRQKLDEAYPGFGKVREAEPAKQGSSQKPEVEPMGVGKAAPVKSNAPLAAGAGPMDKTPPKQGSSQEASSEELDQEAPGKTASSKAKKMPTLTNKGAGSAPNFTNAGDPTSVINQSSSKGNVVREAKEEKDEKTCPECGKPLSECECDDDEKSVKEELVALLGEHLDAEPEALAELADVLEYTLWRPTENGSKHNGLPKLSKKSVKRAAEEKAARAKRVSELESKYSVKKEDLDMLSTEELGLFESLLDSITEGADLTEEDLQELSKSTLANYIARASFHAGANAADASWARTTDKERHARGVAISNKRAKGVTSALEKIKEDVDVSKLFEGDESLTEEFKTKASAMMEGLVVARATELAEAAEDALAEEAANTVLEIREEMIAKLDTYLAYVTEAWMEENEVAIESGVRAELTEGFIAGLKALFTEHYIEVPEDRVDVVAEMAQSIEALEQKLQEQADAAAAITEELVQLKKEQALLAISEGLADTEIEKLRTLTEDLTFDSDESFATKLKVVKENYFPKAPKVGSEEVLTEESISTPDVSPAMAKYVAALSRK